MEDKRSARVVGRELSPIFYSSFLSSGLLVRSGRMTEHQYCWAAVAGFLEMFWHYLKVHVHAPISPTDMGRVMPVLTS